MEATEFAREIEKLLELDANSLVPTTPLADLPKWDSMAVLGIINLADEVFGASPSPKAITKCRTVADLLALCAAK